MKKNWFNGKKIFSEVANWFFPYTCVLCRSPSQNELFICAECQRELPWVRYACLHCGRELMTSEHQLYCGACINTESFFDEIIIPWHYQAPVDRLITHFKFHHQLVYGVVLGKLFADYLETRYQNQELPEYIIPMPLHVTRLKKRGYNQALELARPISRKLNIPIDFASSSRVKTTLPQSELTFEQRQKNVKGAFNACSTLVGKHVALLDDVMTTGNTINEACRALQLAKVRKISVWCCARTELKYAAIIRPVKNKI